MREIARRLKLSHAILDRVPRPLPPDDPLGWAISDNFVRLRGPDWVCTFTPHGNRFSQRRNEGQPVSKAAAETRSDGYVVEEAEIDEAIRQVLLSRKVGTPSQRRRRSLADLAAGFDDSASVRRMTVLADSCAQCRLRPHARRSGTGCHDSLLATVASRFLGAIDDEAQRELATLLDLGGEA